MTSAFQTVFDNAENIAINKRKKVSQTIARDGTLKAISLGGQIWEFEVTLPDGPRWSEYRPLVEQMEALDRVTEATIAINDPGLTWLNGYRGTLSNTGSIVVSYSSGTTLTISSGATTSTGYIFKSGDFIQLGSTGSVYTVVSDVPYNSTSVTVHRPIRESAGTYTLRVGQACEWTVICANFPKWRIFARDQIGWDGPFIFSEAI